MPTAPTESHSESNGGAWAAILAAAIGCILLGLLIDLAEASKAISKTLNFYNPTGDLSGKSTVAVAGWIISWAILHLRWKNQNFHSSARITVVTLILVMLAMIAAFPLFFGLFAAP